MEKGGMTDAVTINVKFDRDSVVRNEVNQKLVLLQFTRQINL